MTLSIPSWAGDLRADGWANIHDIVPAPPRLTGVDAFLGDRQAHTLILGKDCAPARAFRRRVAAGHDDPYSHDPTLPTNLMLSEVLAHVGIDAPLDGSRASDCGLYYANAFYLLRDDNRFSGALPPADTAWAESQKVLAYVLASLPKLERIICMGSDAYERLANHLGLRNTNWRRQVEERAPFVANGCRVYAMSHLGYFGVMSRVRGKGRKACVAEIKDDWAAAFR